jgi:hypothetical protein
VRQAASTAMKKNIRKIPAEMLDRIRAFDVDDVVVACAKMLRRADIARYTQLGLSLDGDRLVIPAPAVPDPRRGRYSTANVEGYTKVRKDLPMEPKTFSFEAPNWGDSYYGTHTVMMTRDVYPRDFYPPKEVELSITLLKEQDGVFVVKFAIEQVLNRRSARFEHDLFYNLNLLQESVGAADVFPSAATLAEYVQTVRVDWEILPVGTVDDVVRAILRGKRPVTGEQEATMRARIDAMSRLRPEEYVAGTDGFLRYFGAKFGDDFVVFENIRYGNALYIMYESWPELSRRSRVELLSGPADSFDRIEHREGWEDALQHRVTMYREEKAKRERANRS